MTYRKKAEQLIMEKLHVSKSIAEDIVRLIDTEGEYAPRVFPELNASDDIDDWDTEIPEGDA